MIWVVDASVAVRWFLEEEADPAADAVLRKLIDVPGASAAPELFAFEVLAVLCRTHPKCAWSATPPPGQALTGQDNPKRSVL